MVAILQLVGGGTAVMPDPADNDATQVRRIAVRFARPVFNGDALLVHAWRSERGCTFTTLNSKGQAVLSQAQFELA